MVVENNATRLRKIKGVIIKNNIQTVSISTTDRVLKRRQMNMKQLYAVPFERNGERVKDLRYQYRSNMYQHAVTVHHSGTPYCDVQ